MAPWNVCMSCSILEANRNILSLCFIHELARGLQHSHSFPLQLSTVAHGVMSGRKKKEESDKQSIRELQNVVVMDKSDGVTCTKTNLASSSLQMSTTAANTLHPGINLLLENLHPIRTIKVVYEILPGPQVTAPAPKPSKAKDLQEWSSSCTHSRVPARI
ncbi:uncharacterized protein LOC133652263 isoform X3 [Entelurus aequoreus]|uniref:uncharacterized protein LOC133652263 isoform X3 n=1 Tax=Entelurus aequoreus TaxID=161455 RepID=UPI002B1D9CC0|nr:uncharacterized protein LOC133652263 isoform X3 [Entelurus aequoreus]